MTMSFAVRKRGDSPEVGASGFRRPGSVEGWIAGIVCWAATLVLCVVFLPDADELSAFLPLGLIALWRWLWVLLQLMRAAAYLGFGFPAYRRAADKRIAEPVPHLGVVCTSYGMEARVNRSVALSLRADIEDLNPATAAVVFSVRDEEDARVIREAFRDAERIDLTILFQDGSGKRRAVADALAALRAKGVVPDSTVLLMDGDTLIPRGTFRKTVPVLRALRDVGALTVHNKPFVDGPVWVRDWYMLRMMQRHIQMSSLSLSERVLVLTGRWSLYRAELALHPDFAAQIVRDTLHDKSEGAIPLVTGEDKSTWRWIIERGYKALYVPDAVVHPLEKLPDPRFFSSSIALMRRWFGNMNRGGKKAIPLGPRRLGWFPWLVLLDQRISMWTSLSGPVCCISAALITGKPQFIALYGVWTLFSRTTHSLLIGALTKTWTPLFPFLMYYTQIVGSLVKVYVFFHPGRQKWTRQNTGEMIRSTWTSTVMMAMVSALFVIAIASTSHGLMSVAR